MPTVADVKAKAQQVRSNILKKAVSSPSPPVLRGTVLQKAAERGKYTAQPAKPTPDKYTITPTEKTGTTNSGSIDVRGTRTDIIGGVKTVTPPSTPYGSVRPVYQPPVSTGSAFGYKPNDPDYKTISNKINTDIETYTGARKELKQNIDYGPGIISEQKKTLSGFKSDSPGSLYTLPSGITPEERTSFESTLKQYGVDTSDTTYTREELMNVYSGLIGTNEKALASNKKMFQSLGVGVAELQHSRSQINVFEKAGYKVDITEGGVSFSQPSYKEIHESIYGTGALGTSRLIAIEAGSLGIPMAVSSGIDTGALFGPVGVAAKWVLSGGKTPKMTQTQGEMDRLYEQSVGMSPTKGESGVNYFTRFWSSPMAIENVYLPIATLGVGRAYTVVKGGAEGVFTGSRLARLGAKYPKVISESGKVIKGGIVSKMDKALFGVGVAGSVMGGASIGYTAAAQPERTGSAIGLVAQGWATGYAGFKTGESWAKLGLPKSVPKDISVVSGQEITASMETQLKDLSFASEANTKVGAVARSGGKIYGYVKGDMVMKGIRNPPGYPESMLIKGRGTGIVSFPRKTLGIFKSNKVTNVDVGDITVRSKAFLGLDTGIPMKSDVWSMPKTVIGKGSFGTSKYGISKTGQFKDLWSTDVYTSKIRPSGMLKDFLYPGGGTRTLKVPTMRGGDIYPFSSKGTTGLFKFKPSLEMTDVMGTRESGYAIVVKGDKISKFKIDVPRSILSSNKATASLVQPSSSVDVTVSDRGSISSKYAQLFSSDAASKMFYQGINKAVSFSGSSYGGVFVAPSVSKVTNISQGSRYVVNIAPMTNVVNISKVNTVVSPMLSPKVSQGYISNLTNISDIANVSKVSNISKVANIAKVAVVPSYVTGVSTMFPVLPRIPFEMYGRGSPDKRYRYAKTRYKFREFNVLSLDKYFKKIGM